MKFGNFFDNNQISEWKDFYLNFALLKKLLKPLEINYKELIRATFLKPNKFGSSSMNLKRDEDLEENLIAKKDQQLQSTLSNFEAIEQQKTFEEQLLRELKKIEYFFMQNWKYYKTRLSKIKDQLDYIKKNKEYKIYKDNLEKALKNLYKEFFLMRDYIEINFKAKIKITKKFRKVTKFLSPEIRLNVESTANLFLSNSVYLNDPLKLLNELIAESEKIFYIHFYDTYSVSTMKVLKDFVASATFTLKQAFYFGFFVGLLVLTTILCIIIAKNFHIDMDNDEDFKSIFPMFRSFWIICLYIWLLGLNVWAWNSAHIDYKLCFHFSNHYSDVISIFKRAAIFSSIMVFMLLCYLILRTRIPILYDWIEIIPLNLTPLVCWLCFLIYLLFPSKNSFNYPGRLYLFHLFCDSFISIFVKTEFKHVWFVDQLTSLVGPMRDMEYTLCYYVNYDTPSILRNELCSNTRGIVLFIGMFPHLVRICQCIRIIYDSGSFLPQILNVGKYFFALILALLSYLLSLHPELHPYWWTCAIISTIYSSFWDLKYDFGFFQQGNHWPLREKLSYKNKSFYYFTMVTNLFLRFMWVLSISPQIVYEYILPEFFSLMIYSFEAIRRGMWNFIRVELQHIQLCKEFKVTVDVELPFKKVNGKFILKNINFVDILKINKRLEKIKTMSEVNMALAAVDDLDRDGETKYDVVRKGN